MNSLFLMLIFPKSYVDLLLSSCQDDINAVVRIREFLLTFKVDGKYGNGIKWRSSAINRGVGGCRIICRSSYNEMTLLQTLIPCNYNHF